MKKHIAHFILTFLVLSILSACNVQTAESTLLLKTMPNTQQLSNTPNPTVKRILFPTITPKPTSTFTPTSTNTPDPTNTFIPSPSPTLAFTPYPTKQVIFDYSRSGSIGVFDAYLDWDWHSSLIVLYADGQMIITGQPYQQKLLTQDEINQFMQNLEDLDFFEIETNQGYDPESDPLYDFDGQYSKITGGMFYYVTVAGEREKYICVFDVYRDYLIPEMENVLEFLDEYQPEDTDIYYPDRILLHVFSGRNPYDDSSDEAVPWPTHLPSLETPGDKITFIDNALDEKILYFEGETAKQIYELLLNSNFADVFTENEIEYTVYYEIVLHHREISVP